MGKGKMASSSFTSFLQLEAVGRRDPVERAQIIQQEGSDHHLRRDPPKRSAGCGQFAKSTGRSASAETPGSGNRRSLSSSGPTE
jgi:hypothetical protein